MIQRSTWHFAKDAVLDNLEHPVGKRAGHHEPGRLCGGGGGVHGVGCAGAISVPAYLVSNAFPVGGELEHHTHCSSRGPCQGRAYFPAAGYGAGAAMRARQI